MKNVLFFLILFHFSIPGISQPAKYKKIELGPGPEDFALDTLGIERLLISCSERRDDNSKGNGIWELNLKSQLVRRLELNLKSDRPFNPHGIYMIYEEGEKYLFVINHLSKNQSEIIRFRVLSNSLVEEKSFTHKYIKHPNDIFVINKHEFYFTNDKLFSGSIIKYTEANYSKIQKALFFPNGIQGLNNKLYVSTTVSNKVFQIYQTPSGYKRKKIARVVGGDNFSVFNNQELLLTSHTKFMKFIRHAKNAEKKSPSRVFKINCQTGEKNVIYSSDGNEINAVSVAVKYKGFLYLGQVFERFIVKVPLNNNHEKD